MIMKLFSKDIYIAVFLFLFAFCLFVSTRSASLDEWDSILYANSIDDFNIILHRPHPPGYPLYVFTAKFINLIFDNHKNTLLFMSNFSGALSIALFFLIMRMFFDIQCSLGASILLAFTQGFWLNSLKALTDIPGTLFFFLSAYFSLKFIASSKDRGIDKAGNEGGTKAFLILAVISIGLGIGVRPQNFALLLPYLFIVLCYKPNLKRIIFSILLLLGVCAIWIIPTLIIHKTKGDVLGAYYKQFLWRIDNPDASVFGQIYSIGYYCYRIFDFLKSFFLKGLGFGSIKFFGIINTLLLTFSWGLFFYNKGYRERFFKYALYLSIPYILMVLLFLPKSGRYFCPIFYIPISAAVYGLLMDKKFPHFSALFKIIFVLLIIVTYINSSRLTFDIHTIKAPPERVVEYISNNYQKANTILLFKDTYCHAKFYLKGWNVEYCTSKERIFEEMEKNIPILIDFKPSFLDSPLKNDNQYFKAEKVVKFKRDKLIHDKHYVVELYVIKKKQ